jgi:hypothetical protein
VRQDKFLEPLKAQFRRNLLPARTFRHFRPPKKTGACLESGVRARIRRFQYLTGGSDLAENPQRVVSPRHRRAGFHDHRSAQVDTGCRPHKLLEPLLTRRLICDQRKTRRMALGNQRHSMQRGSLRRGCFSASNLAPARSRELSAADRAAFPLGVRNIPGPRRSSVSENYRRFGAGFVVSHHFTGSGSCSTTSAGR